MTQNDKRLTLSCQRRTKDTLLPGRLTLSPSYDSKWSDTLLRLPLPETDMLCHSRSRAFAYGLPLFFLALRKQTQLLWVAPMWCTLQYHSFVGRACNLPPSSSSVFPILTGKELVPTFIAPRLQRQQRTRINVNSVATSHGLLLKRKMVPCLLCASESGEIALKARSQGVFYGNTLKLAVPAIKSCPSRWTAKVAALN